MKYRHNARQNQPIVNATDDTSDALIRARTLAQPVCTAADNPTANSGRGAVNACRSTRARWCNMVVLIAVAAALFICGTASAENVTTSAGTTIYEPGGGSVIVDPYITVTGTYATLDATVEISGGFQSGDVLSGGGGSWDGSKGILTITDATNWTTLQNDLRSVTFDTTSGSHSVRTITFTVVGELSDSLYYSGTDHYYEFVSASSVHWTAAKPAAESRSYSGLNGYLATVSSSGENDFISSKLTGRGWMGASDAAVEGVWCWVTGPENGTQFWAGDETGNAVGGNYENWQHPVEPNDWGTDENYAYVHWAGLWNDFADTSSVDGYVVEYGGPGFGGNASESSAMDTKTITITRTCTCGDICGDETGWWRDGGVLNASGTPIQAAIDNATAGETIYVYNGSYSENVDVNERVTLQGEGADLVNVTNSTTNHHVFTVTVDYVNISGFNVSGATGEGKAGFYLLSRQHCNISNNNASGNYYGIYLYSSNNNTLASNTANSNSDYGIRLLSSSYNTIYNNHFNNIQNAYDDGNNIWNTTPTAGTNIIGGSWIGGNCWPDYAGVDTTGDGLGDTLTPYDSSGNIPNGGDYHPLVQAAVTYTPPDPTTLVNTTGNFLVNHTWSAGSGTITDSYNVSVNGVWHNTTTDTFRNDTYTAHAWQNITVYAWNSSTETLSAGSVSQNTRIPNNLATVTNTSDWYGAGGENVYVDCDATDADSDTPTFSCNRTDLFTDFSTATGQGNWTATSGTHYVDFGVSDGWGSTSNYTMTIMVNGTAPPVIHSVLLNPTEVAPNGSINVTVNVTDDSGIASVTADGASLADAGNDTWTGTITAASTPGTYNVTVVATDASPNGNNAMDDSATYIVTEPAPQVTLSIEDVAIRQGENITVPITVFDVVNMGGCELNFTYNPAVVYVADVARGDLNFSFEYTINNGSGWMRANALDVHGQSGNVVFAHVTLAAVGNKSDASEMEFEYSRLVDASFGEITYIRDNGTFSILPNVLPGVTNVPATPGTILYDNGRPRSPGTNITSLSAYVTDTDGSITAVTVNLSSIGGSPAQPMEHVSGDLWEVTTTATEVDINAPNFTHQLAITATDDDGGINDSENIELTILKRGDVNGDGLVDKTDADYISRYLIGREHPPVVLVGDVMGDAGDDPVGNGVVDLMDALYIAKYASDMVGEP